MSDKSSIEWTDASWNRVRGCTKITPGCKVCYAGTFAERFKGVPGHSYEQGFHLRLVPEKLKDPLQWKKPRRLFVNSMSDICHKGVSDEYIGQIAQIMLQADWHTFQVLTKRSERMRDLLNSKLKSAAQAAHIWWGVSVENRKHGVPRIAHLQDANVAVRFLSVEPLIEGLGDIDLTGINWVIVGGESGHGARPFDVEWGRDIIQQCRRQKVACFVKQLGHAPMAGGLVKIKLASSKGGDMDEWPEDLRVREFPKVATVGGAR